ncbi:MAG: metallophosphoesterase [Saprospiraceae bacterium]
MKIVYSFLALLFCCSTNIRKATFFTKPYLQIGNQPSDHSLQVLWHVAESEDSWQVEYKTNDSSKWINSEKIYFTKVQIKNAPFHRIYHASMNNLVSGEEFIYRLFKNSKEVFSSTAKSPKSFNQPYKFVVFGDIGAETDEQKALAQRVMKSNPDFVAVAGDIVYERGLVSEYRNKFWPVYNAEKMNLSGAPIMRSIPWVAAVGNHDMASRDLNSNPDGLAYYMYWEQPLNGPQGREGDSWVPILGGSESRKTAFKIAAGISYPNMTNFSFNYGNSHWTVLDANTYVDWTDSTLVSWVEKDLNTSQEYTWHFVLFHHPGFSSSVAHAEQQHMRLLAPLLEAGHVDIVLSGHVHNYQRTYPMKFKPINKSKQLTGGKNGNMPGWRTVPGLWTLDKKFNGDTQTKPEGVIYIITGAGGNELYNPEQEIRPNTWQNFTYKFISTVHSLTQVEVNGNMLTLKQMTSDGRELDSFTITK